MDMDSDLLMYVDIGEARVVVRTTGKWVEITQKDEPGIVSLGLGTALRLHAVLGLLIDLQASDEEDE